MRFFTNARDKLLSLQELPGHLERGQIVQKFNVQSLAASSYGKGSGLPLNVKWRVKTGLALSLIMSHKG